jgi:hypothetical protein
VITSKKGFIGIYFSIRLKNLLDKIKPKVKNMFAEDDDVFDDEEVDEEEEDWDDDDWEDDMDDEEEDEEDLDDEEN